MSDTNTMPGSSRANQPRVKQNKAKYSTVHQVTVAVQTDPITAKRRRTHTLIHLKRPNWSLLCFSVAIMATVAVAISFGVSLAAIVTRWNEVEETVAPRNASQDEKGRALPKTGCGDDPMDPPSYPCILWDWDEISRQVGTEVNYYCDGGVVQPDPGPVLTLICKGEDLKWTVVTNNTDVCECNLVTGIYNNVGYSQR